MLYGDGAFGVSRCNGMEWRISEGPSSRVRTGTANANDDSGELLAGKRALILEDNAIIALDVEQILRAFGAAEIDVATTTERALSFVEGARPDIALLDVEVGSDTCEAVAELLAGVGSPFAFTTGYGAPDGLTEKFPLAPLIEKPFDQPALEAAIRKLLSAPPTGRPGGHPPAQTSSA